MGHDKLKDWYHIMQRMDQMLEYELTMRQWRTLMHIYLIEEKHTVTSLSDQLNIPKPAICRGLELLTGYDFVKRIDCTEDRRLVYCGKTLKGIEFLQKFSDILEAYYSQDAGKKQKSQAKEKTA
jgi:DNA-binding MarR family transcriptional regulator